jgi:aquaporin NIP
MRKYLAELLGTFALVFAGTGAIVIDSATTGGVTHVGIAITFGLIVMAMIYALGEASGAHFNPAVTIGFFLARRFRGTCVLPYIGSQLLGGFLASAVLRLLFGNIARLGATVPAGSAMQSFGLEVILTAILMFVILSVATGSKEQGLMAGIAIGGTVGLEAMFAGPICGASMNPVRSIAPALVSGHLEFLWVYIIAPLVGAVIAVPCWLVTGNKPSGEVAANKKEELA